MLDVFCGTDYLKEGNSRQRNAWRLLSKYGIFEKFSRYSPLLAGTVPIGIDLPSSDLDIICKAEDTDGFCAYAEKAFGCMNDFRINRYDDGKVVICSFCADDIAVEIYCSDTEPRQSDAFRHMLVEWKILQMAGDRFIRAVCVLKSKGMKTEPAFAELLGLRGDPFEKILELETLSAGAISEMLRMQGFQPVRSGLFI